MVLWNANGLTKHTLEVKKHMQINNIDVMLISETHFTEKNHFSIPGHKFYHTMHPDGKAHGGSAILIKNNIRHYPINNYCTEKLQSTNIVIEDWSGPIIISAVYSPPKHTIKQEDYEDFFKSLGLRFIVGGDFNAKHTFWGSRIITPKGRQLLFSINKLRLGVASTGEPTYWPTDTKKKPDLIDFYITKGISSNHVSCKSSAELSSDHSPVELLLSRWILQTEKPCRLHSRKTNWTLFRELIANSIDMKVPLKSDEDITNAVEHFDIIVQQAAWATTPPPTASNSDRTHCSLPVRELLSKKRKARKRWQATRHPDDRTAYNKLTAQLKKLLSDDRNQGITEYLQQLDAKPSTDYSLWKATRSLKRPINHLPPLLTAKNSWAYSDAEKAEVFKEHLQKVFRPNHDVGSTKIDVVSILLEQTHQLDPPIDKFSKTEIKTEILKLDAKKAPGYDLITATILKELPEEGIKYITQLYNAILQRAFVPPQWKVAKIIMIPKPGKNPADVKSYRPISLLPIPSKVMEKLFLRRLNPTINEYKLIPDYQFGFRREHSTIEQIHRLVEGILQTFERKEYCTASFLDISQAFDKVWHDGLLYKIKKLLPINYYNFIRSYLVDRHFFVSQGETTTELKKIEAGVPQGSVMGPILYLLYTADLPICGNVITGTFADDTAIMASAVTPNQASLNLQNSLDKISAWLIDWRIKANETKSVQVTFTTRRQTCPPVMLNGVQLPQSDEVKYLGMYLDRRLTWRKHIFTKRLAMGQQIRKMYWLINKNSQLSIDNKILLYKSIIKPIWSYGLQLWGSSANSNLEILQRFQSKILRMITDAPWYITNERLHRELGIKTVKEEIREKIKTYKDRLKQHPNPLAHHLMDDIFPGVRRLKKRVPQDLL